VKKIEDEVSMSLSIVSTDVPETTENEYDDNEDAEVAGRKADLKKKNKKKA
jgi:hypothetical protein